MTDRTFYENLDSIDPLAPLRAEFHLPADTIYLNGNSLGVMPLAAPVRAKHVMLQEWADDLTASWNEGQWSALPLQLGNKIAPLVGAGPDEIVVCDSTSVNLYKVLYTAMDIMRRRAPEKRRIVSEKNAAPTDLYIAQTLCTQFGMTLELVDSDALHAAVNDHLAILLLTHVNYQTGAVHDMADLTARAHLHGALTVWDVCHSVGAIRVAFEQSDADFAVGCTYAYLNGGPGAPAFVWVHPRHRDQIVQPLTGWMGHAAPLAFEQQYQPAAGILRYLCGTPAILSLSVLETGLDVFHKAQGYGGMTEIHKKAQTLTSLFIQLAEKECAGFGLSLLSPRDPEQRAGAVSLTHPHAAHAIIQALRARGVIGEYCEPGILRFGFAPLYTRYTDAWDAVTQLRAVLTTLS